MKRGFKRRYSKIALLLLVAPGALAGCRTSETSGVAEKPLHLYVLAGQSNMAGRGVVGQIDSTRHPRVFALKADMTWGPAREPLHLDKPNIVGVGPGYAFGRAMADRDTAVTIGLIPTAVGGSSVGAWRPGGEHGKLDVRPYDDAISRVFRVMALHGGKLKGIIWHQGESDRNSPPDEHLEHLVELVNRFRTEFQTQNLPFVAAQMAEFYTRHEPGAFAINEAIAKLPSRVPFTQVVSAEGFTHKGDSVHLDARSERELGDRYAKAMIRLQQ